MPKPSTSFETENSSIKKEGFFAEKQRDELDFEIEKLETNYNNYVKVPENHPKYAEEWRIFWAKTYKEVQKKGLDPQNYDYKSDWLIFWKQKLSEIHNEELEEVKKRMKKKYGEILKSSSSPKRFPPSYDHVEMVPPPKKKYRTDTAEDYNVCENSTKVVTLLRFLSALEAELGLLGKRVLDWLMKAVAMENTSKNSSESLLNDETFYNTLDTCREKLKGLITAQLLEPKKIKLAKDGVQKIASLLRSHNKVLQENPYSLEIDTEDPVSKLKAELARAITENLRKARRENLSQEELTKIVEEFFVDIIA